MAIQRKLKVGDKVIGVLSDPTRPRSGWNPAWLTTVENKYVGTVKFVVPVDSLLGHPLDRLTVFFPKAHFAGEVTLNSNDVRLAYHKETYAEV